jgi:hypothetical protein
MTGCDTALKRLRIKKVKGCGPAKEIAAKDARGIGVESARMRENHLREKS